MTDTTGSNTRFAAASALSNHIDTRTAATEAAYAVAETLSEQGIDRPDLLLTYGSFHHGAGLRGGAETLRSILGPRHMLAMTSESVLDAHQEREGRAGLSVLALSLGDVSISTFDLVPGQIMLPANDPAALRQLAHVDERTRAMLLMVDPFTTNIAPLVQQFAACRGERHPLPIGGGLASGSSKPGGNVLVVNDQIRDAGLIGLTIGEGVEIDFLVSQGCRPIGEPIVVTKAEQNAIMQLAGRPALDVVQEFAENLPEHDRQLLNKGLFVGVVIDEYKERFGRGDFLIRNVVGIDQKQKSIAVNDLMRPGRTIQFHVRDAATASEDLQLLLDLQQLKGQPFAGTVFTCNSRGTRLFDKPHHDAHALRDRLGDIPLAGCFAAGEIGPIGDSSFVHGHTVSAMFFRGV